VSIKNYELSLRIKCSMRDDAISAK